MIGKTINNYLIERKLGEGGMGEVYYARHNKVDREVAIKVLHSHLFQNEHIHNRFKNEANALIKLNHPNIVKIYDYVEQENFACLIMEYISGYTLDVYLTKYSGPLASSKASSIMSSILDAVQYAHDSNIFHRDIKPGNIMISSDGNRVRIMDFGIAKLTDTAGFQTTHANTQLGTPFYMSPEQVKGLPYTRASDIYSLGVTLFEMVTGKCPYQDIKSLFELQMKIVNEPLPLTSKYYPNVSSRIQNAISKATSKLPEARFQSCIEFRQFLMDQEQSHVQPPPSSPVTNKKSRSKLGWLAYLLIGVIIIALVVIGSVSTNEKNNYDPIKKVNDNGVNGNGSTAYGIGNNDSNVVAQDSMIQTLNSQNTEKLYNYIERKQKEKNKILSQAELNFLTDVVSKLDHSVSEEELKLHVDTLFYVAPKVQLPSDARIKEDFKRSVSGLTELCRVPLDDYSNQVNVTSIYIRPTDMVSPPQVLLVTVNFTVADAEDPNDITECYKNFQYNKTGTTYQFGRMQ